MLFQRAISRLAAVATLCVGGFVYAGAGITASGESSTQAASAKVASIEHFRVAAVGDAKGIGTRFARPIGVVAHGVFTGAGRAVEDGQIDTFHLGGGTLVVRITLRTATTTWHNAACFFTASGRGRYHILSGTGRFAGVTGRGTVRYHGQGVSVRPAHGPCDVTRKPRYEFDVINAQGSARMP